MPCLVCGHSTTCRAHIMPAALGKDMIKKSDRKTLSLLAPDFEHNFIQSGIFDEEILCAVCDGELNCYDKHAIEILRLIGTDCETISSNVFMVRHARKIDHQSLALFAAAVVWRSSISKRIQGLSGFTLGNNEPWFRAMIFRKTLDVPNVVIARTVGETSTTHQAALAALSYPVAIRSKSHQGWVARFHARGLMFLVSTSQTREPWMRPASVTEFGRSKGPTCLVGHCLPFEGLADLRQAMQSKYIQSVLAKEPQLYGTKNSALALRPAPPHHCTAADMIGSSVASVAVNSSTMRPWRATRGRATPLRAARCSG